MSNEMDRKRSKCEKIRAIRRAIKVDPVDTSAELIPKPETNSYHYRLHDEIMRGL